MTVDPARNAEMEAFSLDGNVDPPGAELNLLAGLRNGEWLDAQHFAPLRYAVPGIIAEGSSLLVGPPKIGKSWFVLSVALAVASGGRALGRLTVDQRRVLYLALEDGDRRLQDRCRKLLERAPIPAAFEYLTMVQPGMAIATIEAWLALHAADEPLVILDTLGKVMPPALLGESSYQRDYRIGSQLKYLVDQCPGSALVTNHHDRKAGSEDFVDSVSGTHGLAGAADTVIVLNRARHEASGVIKVTGRDVAEGEYALTFSSGGLWQVDGDGLESAAAKAEQDRATAGLGDRSAEVVAFVGTHADGVSAGKVEAQFGEDARRYLARLAKSGRIRRVAYGVYAPVSQVSQCPTLDEELGQRDTWDTHLGDNKP